MPEAAFILASASRTRAQILRGAGLDFAIERPPLDEDAHKAALRALGLTVRDQAEKLAAAKALSVAKGRPELVIGADQMLAFEGRAFDKPANRAEARAQLLALRGRQHELVTALVAARGGEVVWSVVERPRLSMRAFTDAFLETYLERAGESVLHSVGAYQLEGEGAQLFDAIEGDYFAILGLPLLPLLAFLRDQGLLAR